MVSPSQPDLFGADSIATAAISGPSRGSARLGLFADVVFDRPLDHAYSYAVTDQLRDKIEVGKRVKAPFGRGDRATIGYCVRLSETPPERPAKQLLDVLDDEPLLTDNLLRL